MQGTFIEVKNITIAIPIYIITLAFVADNGSIIG
jgi:hypothetical protein